MSFYANSADALPNFPKPIPAQALRLRLDQPVELLGAQRRDDHIRPVDKRLRIRHVHPVCGGQIAILL